MDLNESYLNFFTRAMSTKYIESEARVMSPVLIEGIAEVKRLLKRR